MCSSSGESFVSIRHLAYVTLCRSPSGIQVWMELELRSISIHTCVPDGDLHRVTYARCRIDINDSPDDEHVIARNM